MNNKMNITAIMMFVAMILCSCKINIEKIEEGDLIEKNYPVSEFSALQFGGAADVNYVLSDTISVRLKGPENVLNDVRVETDAYGVLNIYKKDSKENKIYIMKSGNISGYSVYISGPSLKHVQVLGSGKFECKDTMNVEEFSASVAGSGEVFIDGIKTSTFTTSIAGSGEMYIKKVYADKASMSISGSGEVKTAIDGAQQTLMQIAGSGEAHIYLSDCDEATVEIAGSGDVTLGGNVNKLVKKISGSGDIDTEKLRTNEIKD